MIKIIHVNQDCYMPGVYNKSLNHNKHCCDEELFKMFINRFSQNDKMPENCHQIIVDMFNLVICGICLSRLGISIVFEDQLEKDFT